MKILQRCKVISQSRAVSVAVPRRIYGKNDPANGKQGYPHAKESGGANADRTLLLCSTVRDGIASCTWSDARGGKRRTRRKSMVEEEEEHEAEHEAEHGARK